MQTQALFFLPNGISRICVCVDSTCHNELQGRWYHLCRSAPQPFETVVQLLAGLEHCCNELCFPQSTMALRRLAAPGRRLTGQGNAERKEWKQYMSQEELQIQKGKKATFIVQIQFRQNATWQGTVTWTEKNETVHFRSALELLKMMDESIGETALVGEEAAAQEAW